MQQVHAHEEPTSEEIKQCCAMFYASDWAQQLLGESYHPGGVALTERLGRLLDLGPGDRVLDVACGSGTSALHLAALFGCQVTGVDYSRDNIERARQKARDADLVDRVTFQHGDAEHLNYPTAAFDVVMCECALCTFPDKPAATREFRRVLGAGGRVGISDVTRDGVLPPELTTLFARSACIADALAAEGYAAVLTGAGFSNVHIEPHQDAAMEVIERVRLGLLGMQVMAGLGQPTPLSRTDLRRGLDLTKLVAQAARDGQLGYTLVIARLPSA